MEKPERSVYTPQDFLQWREAGSLELTPKFQRRGVWTAAARSFFVDTLLRQMPVPPIYIRMVQSEDRKHSVRQVIDGQQRISCVLDYLDGKFRLSRTLPGSWAGKTFEGLTPDEQQQITTYTLSSELFYGISDSEVLQIFARLPPVFMRLCVNRGSYVSLCGRWLLRDATNRGGHNIGGAALRAVARSN